MCRMRYRIAETHSVTGYRLCVLIYVNGRYPHFMRPRVRDNPRFYDEYAERVLYLSEIENGKRWAHHGS